MKLHYVCKAHLSKFGFYTEMSNMAGKPKFTSWKNFGRAGWEIQNQNTNLFFKILKF